MDPPRPTTPVQKTHGFEIKHGSITYNGHSRVSVTRLRELLRPDSVPQQRERNATRAAAKALVTEKWLLAQLQFYDISLRRKNISKVELENALKDAADRGACDAVPAPITALEEKLSAEYAPLYNEYKDEIARWQSDKVAAQRNRYYALSTASAKANYDLHLFMREFFLNAAGKPDIARTPSPMALSGVNHAAVHARAEIVQGLFTASGGSGVDRTLVIGWGQSRVLAAAAQIDARVALQHKKALDAAWNAMMRRHQVFKSKRAATHSEMDWDASNCRGSYIIECPMLEHGFDTDKTKASLRVAEKHFGKLMAVFNFGAVEGVMHLAAQAAQLPHKPDAEEDVYYDQSDGSEREDDSEQDDQSDPNGVSDQEDASDGDHDSDEDHSSNGDHDFDVNHDLLRNHKSKPQVPLARKRKQAPTPTPPTQRKRHAPPPTHPRRVHLLWRGSETDEGRYQNSRDQKGHMDFSDAAGIAVEGVIYVEFCGKTKFKGYKTSGMGGPVADTWEEYSDAARVGLWG